MVHPAAAGDMGMGVLAWALGLVVIATLVAFMGVVGRGGGDVDGDAAAGGTLQAVRNLTGANGVQGLGMFWSGDG